MESVIAGRLLSQLVHGLAIPANWESKVTAQDRNGTTHTRIFNGYFNVLIAVSNGPPSLVASSARLAEFPIRLSIQCRQLDAETALRFYSPQRKRMLKLSLENGQGPEWWNTRAIWRRWNAAVRDFENSLPTPDEREEALDWVAAVRSRPSFT